MAIRTSSHSRFRSEIPFREGALERLAGFPKHSSFVLTPRQFTELVCRAKTLTIKFKASITYTYNSCPSETTGITEKVEKTEIIEVEKNLKRKILKQDALASFDSVYGGQLHKDYEDADENDVMLSNLRALPPRLNGLDQRYGYAIWASDEVGQAGTGQFVDFIRISSPITPFERTDDGNLILSSLAGQFSYFNEGFQGIAGDFKKSGKTPECPAIADRESYGGDDINVGCSVALSLDLPKNAYDHIAQKVSASFEVLGSIITLLSSYYPAAWVRTDNEDIYYSEAQVTVKESSVSDCSLKITEWFQYAESAGDPAYDAASGATL